ncbi:hypothetical protein QBC43DRAFT_310393 [Cladorrhinum sp. PSN259]|nr:hypothetical protein QBC43DRAFT_310393 [Cladorrhinum sp. PSN259]
MRLINIHTLRMHEFVAEIPKYVILSHTWGSDEVSFQEMEEIYALEELEDIITQHPGYQIDIGTLRQRARIQETKQRAGYRKIIDFCAKIRHESNRDSAELLEWAWVDTCCIDKKSSSELSEAINSMFEWYWRAAVCWVYLSDVPTPKNFEEEDTFFRNSRWFTRGWTLQELLAPPSSEKVIFFDSRWREIGTRASKGSVISEITGIDRDFLDEPGFAILMDEISISERMSWASRRRTTRPEDMAYCLLGIFYVSMPLLYGEGAERAFIRLQLEIMKKSADQTILAWGWQQSLESAGKILAPDVKLFANGHRFQQQPRYGFHPPFHMTNSGLSIRLTLYKIPGRPFLFASLNCTIATSKDTDLVVGFFVVPGHGDTAHGWSSEDFKSMVHSDRIAKFGSSSTTVIPQRLLGESVERSILLLPATSEALAAERNTSLYIEITASDNWEMVECFPLSFYERWYNSITSFAASGVVAVDEGTMHTVKHHVCPIEYTIQLPKGGPWLFRFLGPDQSSWVLCFSDIYFHRPQQTPSTEDNLLSQLILLVPADKDMHLATLAQHIQTNTILESAADLDSATVNMQMDQSSKLNVSIDNGRRLQAAVQVKRSEINWIDFEATCTVLLM